MNLVTSFLSFALVLTTAACTGSQALSEREAPQPQRPPASQLRPAMANIPDAPPFVGGEGVDEYGYPMRGPDRIVLLSALRLQRFDELTRWLTHYQDEFEADFRKELWPLHALRAFEIPDPSLEPLFDAWIQSSPDHFAPWAARGMWRAALATSSRGGKFASETTERQFAEMKAHHDRAVPDLERAIELRPRLVAAHHELIQIGMMGSDRERTQVAYAAATTSCPLCVEPRVARAWSRIQRWGGSPAELEALAAKAKPLVRDNPKLAVLRGFVAYERCYTLQEEKKYREAAAACDEALSAGRHHWFSCRRGTIASQQERFAEALSFFDRGLQTSPHERECLVRRQYARRKTGDIVGAGRDLAAARQLDPTEDDITEAVDWTVKKLRFDAQELGKVGRNDEADAMLEVAIALAPDDADLKGRRAWNRASADVDDLLAQAAAAPDDFELRLQIDHALATKRRFPEIVKMWDVYIAGHPEDGRAHRERGGARWHARDTAGAIADTERACELGIAEACRDVPRMRSRAGR